MRGFLPSLPGLMAIAGLVHAQFASAPNALTPMQPNGAAAVPPVPTANPWYVKPEYGAWMICVKSYSDDKDHHYARINAEALASDIRERYKVPAYLFERGGAEREAERQRHAREVAKKRAEQAAEEAAFNAVLAQAQAEAKAKGMEFLSSRPEIKAPTIRYEEQYAVLIGGWPTMDAARKEMEKMRTWEPPANKALMDRAFAVNADRRTGEQTFINPFKSCMVVPNPVAPRVPDAEGDADAKFVFKMNANEEYSVLKIQKNWTIAVKQYAPPIQIKDKEEKSFMARLLSDKPDAMSAAAGQARNMAIALRNMKPTKEFPYGPFESYVLHTKYGSLLCVGQFDGPEDPKLLEIQSQLGMMKFNVKVEDGQKLHLVDQKEIKLFDRLYAMKVR